MVRGKRKPAITHEVQEDLVQENNATSGKIEAAARLIAEAKHLVAFTGAGISVESGIPPFRGDGGLWDDYDPAVLDIGNFYRNPKDCWIAIREIFYLHFGKARPNAAHNFLARLEDQGLLKSIITQNIDNLHFLAGSKSVFEYHGNSRLLRCPVTGDTVEADSLDLLGMTEESLPPLSPAGGVYKPDFVFFGEGIPGDAAYHSAEAARKCDVMLVIGSTGEVYPAAGLPVVASQLGAKIIEINPGYSAFSTSVADIHITMPAVAASQALAQAMGMDPAALA